MVVVRCGILPILQILDILVPAAFEDEIRIEQRCPRCTGLKEYTTPPRKMAVVRCGILPILQILGILVPADEL